MMMTRVMVSELIQYFTKVFQSALSNQNGIYLSQSCLHNSS